MVAVPDYVATAMENWGLFFFQEITLLYDPQESSASDKQRVALWVSHELAHLVDTQSRFSVNRSFCQICQNCIRAEKIQQKNLPLTGFEPSTLGLSALLTFCLMPCQLC